MVDYYTEHYSPRIGVTGHATTHSAVNPVLAPYEKHGRLRYTSARIYLPLLTDIADDEVIRLFDMRSSDCLHKLYISSGAGWAAAASHFNIGLHEKGDADDGAVIDESLFAGTIDFAAGIARTDYFNGSGGGLDDHHRGRPLWFIANIGGGTYTEDPHEVWTITMKAQENITVVDAAVTMLAEAFFVSGQ